MGSYVGHYQSMSRSSERRYHDAFESLTDVLLEDSWILHIEKSSIALVFSMEIALTPDHIRYKIPEPGEQHCYCNGQLTIASASPITFEGFGFPAAVDATGERDYGHIDVFAPKKGDVWELAGDWGKVEIVSPDVSLVLTDS